MQTKKKMSPLLLIFLSGELVLYYLILTASGELLRWSSYIAIVFCFLFALSAASRKKPLIISGLFCTVLADFCLVICDPIQQLYGMLFFLVAQIFYAVMLHRQKLHKALLLIRITLVALVEIVAVCILREKTDALALVSMAYYANLITNLLCTFSRFRKNKLLAIGLVCFLLCDTVIGFQVAAGTYLPIAEGSLLHKIIFVNFNLPWFFYLPSQVLIALSSRKQST